MDDEDLALLNAKIGGNGTNGFDATKIDQDPDECRSLSIAGKSDTSSTFGDSEDLSSSVVDDDSADEYSKTCIRVGDSYQVFIPITALKTEDKDDPREGVLMWKESETITNDELSEYLKFAADVYHFTIEQALGLLLWHNYNIRMAKEDLSNFEPTAEVWNADEIALFEEAYKLHGKRFYAYSELLPHKSNASLVDYYYSRYKRRSSSFNPMNLRSGHTGGAFSSAAISSVSQRSIGASIQEKETQYRKSSAGKSEPAISKMVDMSTVRDPRINVLPSLINPSNPQQPVARSTGKKAPAARPPRGLYLKLEELASLASLSAPSKSSNSTSDPLDSSRTELTLSIDKVQQQRLRCQEYKRQLGNGIQSFIQPSAAKSGNPQQQPIDSSSEPQWTKQETSLAVAAFRQYGPNFGLIADFIGTKAESHVRYFYQTYRNRYNLDALLADYEAEKRNLSLFPTPEEDFLMRKGMSSASRANGVANNGVGNVV